MKSKREIKDDYREMKFKIGVFQIKNIDNNKIYVDSSIDLVAIWNRHRFQLKNGLHPNIYLQKEWSEFGEKKFIFEILSEIKQDATKSIDYRKEAKELEKMFIEELQPFDDSGYNLKAKSRQ